MIKNCKGRIKRLSLLVLAIVPVLLYLPYYLRGEMPGTADLIQYFSTREYMTQCIVNGEFPQWNHYLANGMPQAGIANLHLVNILFLLFPLKETIYLFFIVQLIMGSFFFYLYLRECGSSYLTSIILAVIYECSIQINGFRRNHPSIVIAICFFPVIMFLVRKFFNTRQTKWFCLSAVVAGIQAATVQQYSVYALLILLIYILRFYIRDKAKVLEIIKKGIMWVAIYIGIFSYTLLPVLSVIREYVEHGASSTPYEIFSSYSIHPIKLLQMIVPEFFGDLVAPLSTHYSSELDIELYLGIFVLLLVLCAIFKNKKNWQIRTELICAIVAFSYAAVAHIPFVDQFIYRVPLLGSFRCAGRMLYVFYFFMLSLAGQGLENIFMGNFFSEKISWMKKIAVGLCAVLFSFFLIGLFVIFFMTAPNSQAGYYYSLSNKLLLPICYSGIITVVLYVLLRTRMFGRNFTMKWKRIVTCTLVLAITLAEIVPYSMNCRTTELSSITQIDESTHKIMESIGNYKIWDAVNYVDIEHESIVSQNRGQLWGISSINAYTAYNNPLLVRYLKNAGTSEAAFNSSGLLTGTPNAYNILVFQNDLLSMLGVRYVIDANGVIESTGGKIYSSDCESTRLALCKNVILQMGEDGVCVSEIAGGVQKNTCYRVTIVVNKEDNKKLSYLGVDLFGGECYDLPEKQKGFVVDTSSNKYVAYLYSDNAELVTEDIRVRVLAETESTKIVRLERCEICAVEPEEAYQYWGLDKNGTKIYENSNVKDILYFPDQVKRKKNFDVMYDDYEKFELDTTAYVDRKISYLRNEESSVEVLSYGTNSITAKVISNSDTYLCFSQNYSSNWSVQIDGKEQKVDMVNGVIMGTDIPKGEHTVVFVYDNPCYKIGYSITTATCVVLIFGYITSCCRRRKRRRETR